MEINWWQIFSYYHYLQVINSDELQIYSSMMAPFLLVLFSG